MTEEKEVAVENGQENKETKEVDSELESAIIRQVEYYFSDANLPRDKFLREQVKLDDGWVPLDVLTRFNRLAKLSTDTDLIANVLNNSTSGLLEVSEDNKKIRRNPELPIPEMNEERRKEMTARTIYAKGFPKEALLDDILKYFKQFEEVENVIMRKYLERSTKRRLFKGSVFATFKTKDQATKFMETKDLKYEETPLITFWQDEYLQQKQEEYQAKKDKRDKKHKDKEEKDDFKLPTGTVFHFSEGADTMKREDVKEALVKLGAEVAYIDFKVGDTEGWVRLAKENSAKEIAEKITDGKIKIGEKDVVFKILEGDEETEYLTKTVEEMVKRRKNQKNNSRQNKGKNKGGYKQGRKRRQDQNDDGPPSKVKADS
ncbi:la protein homolog [Ostrinia nubilalis]|uniref:la protein homolog n=1 Tax=Ostrinia furnacalis TaxID=93504 RepID=UPI00103A57B2|nr:la protein homolog [Ostrinia furnacalis]XP_028160866.1 la protein homolog [Ostrinia furnacalis]